MPELAEVAYACSQWTVGIGHKVKEVTAHPTSRVYRDLDRSRLQKKITGSTLSASDTCLLYTSDAADE